MDGKTTEFIWQGSRLIAETDNDKHWQTYLYEPDSYRPLALVHGNEQQDNIKLYWYQNDHLGTPIALTSNMGDTLYECQYNAYGQIINETYHQDDFNALPDNPLRFQGQYYDEETGLHYNLNRYYDPFTGRYITQDPIGILSDINLYRYVGNNPISGIDPLGLDFIDLYRGTDNTAEIQAYYETGWVFSETGYRTYEQAIREGLSIKDALSKAIIESKYAHAKQIHEWGTLDQYIRAHGEWGQELKEIGQRSLISFTTNAEKATEWGFNSNKIIIHIRIPKSQAIQQTLETSTELEYLIINGVKP
jgi:RHS repeat-associated protein